MAKRRITNFKFRPGISRSANLYPKAYALLIANKSFILAQLVAYIQYNVANSIAPFVGYTFDPAKCLRDDGLVLDAIAHDLRYGGNVEIRDIAQLYWIEGIPQIGGTQLPEINATNYLRDLINNYIFTNTAATPTYGQTAVSQTFIAGQNAESGAAARVTAEVLILTNIIPGGPSTLPAEVPGISSVKIQGNYAQNEILLITNTTDNEIIYNFADNTKGGTIVYKNQISTGGGDFGATVSDLDFPSYAQTTDSISTLYLDVDTSSMSSSDSLQVLVEDDAMIIKPWDFGIDAIERMRVAAPQAMLDADFEYGLQPTKWQAIGLQRSYPGIYEVPGSDQTVLSVTTDASSATGGVGNSLITVQTAGAHGYLVGDPISIKNLSPTITGSARAEGSFLVNTVPSNTTFTFYAQAKVGTSNGQQMVLANTQLRAGDFYTGASLGDPDFTVFSNGTTNTVSSKFVTQSGTDRIAYIGSAPSPGSPITGGTGIAAGSQVAAVTGTGGLQSQKELSSGTAIDDVSITLLDSTGITTGFGIDRGDGTVSFVTGVVGNVVSLSSPIKDVRRGAVTSSPIAAPAGDVVSPIGTGATFDISRSGGAYTAVDSEDSTANGQNYFVGDKILFLGSNLGGASPANDLVLRVTSVDSGGSILTTTVHSGTSITGGATYPISVFDEVNTVGGSGAEFSVIRTGGTGQYTVNNTVQGTGYQVADTLKIYGTNLGGATPANDLTISVLTVDTGGEILTFSTSGTGATGDQTYTGQSGTNVTPIGTNAVINVSRNAGTYTATVNSGGSGYQIGDRFIIDGADLEGDSSNNLELRATAVSGGAIDTVEVVSGTAIGGEIVDFYSSFTVTELTTSSIPDGTSINLGALATLEVTFPNAHGLVPGATVLIDITSTGTNHTLGEGPYIITNIPSITSFRYQARAGGNIDDSTVLLTGSVYVRPDSFFIHRPFDGGVQLGTGGPQHSSQAVRQSKKYIRYQSGKGIMYTTGGLFAPTYDLASATADGTAINSLITFTVDGQDHGFQIGCVVEVTGLTTSTYNATFTVVNIVNERTFKVRTATVLTTTTGVLGPLAAVTLKNWHGASVRAGVFDEQNGIFYQYDGQYLSLCKRSSTFQLIGTVSVTPDSNLVSGSGTNFLSQVHAGDKIVIRGMSHTVSHVASNTSMTITPDYRGASAQSGVKVALTQDLVVPQSEWNMDKGDGTGNSGYDIKPWKMQMIGMQYSWYAVGFIEYMIRGADGKFVFLHRIRNSNVNTEAYMRTANLPVRYEVINESAKSYLRVAMNDSQNTIVLVDAYFFPTSGTVYIDNEIISYTGKNGNTLTGCTRGTTYSNFAAGATRTYNAGAASAHTVGTGVVLISVTATPIISHWGSALLTDGMFDEDRGYLFSYAATGLTITTTKTTAFLIRLAPSVSNAIVGDLGERDLLNRAQLLLQSIEVATDTSTGTVVIEGVLNPQNYPLNPVDIDWQKLSGLAGGGQPSFAQIAPGGSVNWNGGGGITTATATTINQVDVNVTVPNNTVFNRGSGSTLFYVTRASWEASKAVAGTLIADAKFPAGTTITSFGGPFNFSGIDYYFFNTSQRCSSAVNANANINLRLPSPPAASTNVLYFTKTSWEALGAGLGTEVNEPTKFPANTRVQNISALKEFSSTQYYEVTFNQTTIASVSAGGTITFQFGQPPYALPGETIFSFISTPGSREFLPLPELKELTASTLGGRGAFPNGPDVLAINIYKTAGTGVAGAVILRWSEAQA